MGASKVRAATRPHKGYCCARLRGTKRTRGLKALPAPRVEKTERGGGAGKRERRLCACATRVNESLLRGKSEHKLEDRPGRHSSPCQVGGILAGQALHLASNRRNCKRSPPCAEERPTLHRRPICNVVGKCGLHSIWSLGLESPFQACSKEGKKKKPKTPAYSEIAYNIQVGIRVQYLKCSRGK